MAAPTLGERGISPAPKVATRRNFLRGLVGTAGLAALAPLVTACDTAIRGETNLKFVEPRGTPGAGGTFTRADVEKIVATSVAEVKSGAKPAVLAATAIETVVLASGETNGDNFRWPNPVGGMPTRPKLSDADKASATFPKSEIEAAATFGSDDYSLNAKSWRANSNGGFQLMEDPDAKTHWLKTHKFNLDGYYDLVKGGTGGPGVLANGDVPLGVGDISYVANGNTTSLVLAQGATVWPESGLEKSRKLMGDIDREHFQKGTPVGFTKS